MPAPEWNETGPLFQRLTNKAMGPMNGSAWKAVSYLFANGHVAADGVSGVQRHQLAAAIDLSLSQSYEVFRPLLDSGLIVETEVAGERRFTVNLDWEVPR